MPGTKWPHRIAARTRAAIYRNSGPVAAGSNVKLNGMVQMIGLFRPHTAIARWKPTG